MQSYESTVFFLIALPLEMSYRLIAVFVLQIAPSPLFSTRQWGTSVSDSVMTSLDTDADGMTRLGLPSASAIYGSADIAATNVPHGAAASLVRVFCFICFSILFLRGLVARKSNGGNLTDLFRLEFNLEDIAFLQLFPPEKESGGRRDVAGCQRDVLVAGQRLEVLANPRPRL